MAAAIALALLALTPAQSGATEPAHPSRLRHCQDIDVGKLHVSRIRSNYSCSYVRRALRSLLRNGVSSLPRKRRTGRWVCRKQGSTRVCSKVTRRQDVRASRILFRTAVLPDPGPPPPPPPPPPIPPAPQDCLDLWNADATNLAQYGVHFYADHGIRKAWVFHTDDGRCAVIGVVPPNDYEYGADGEVSRPGGGWDLMSVVFGDPVAKQGQAADLANASLDATGKLARL